MIFGEKNLVISENCFTSNDLYQYVAILLKEATQRNKRNEISNYDWLKSKNRCHKFDSFDFEHNLKDLRPMIYKMTSESSAAIAVKLDTLTAEHNFTVSGLLKLVKKMLLEQDNMRLMENNVKRVKETNNAKGMKKVQPELVGRQATVCFILDIL